MEDSQPPQLDYYFDSYSHFGIHEEMLKDRQRTLAYRSAILKHRNLFEGKTVLDVGCGTGILSMFAALAGAKLVIGVDMSGMAVQAKRIVAANGLSERVVILRGKMEEVQLPVDKVDIIISEWMGYALLYESMLATVLFARDNYLSSDGLIFPDRARLYVAAIEDGEYKSEKVHYWDDVYGFDMSCIKPMVLAEPLVDVVDGKSLISESFCVFDGDLYVIQPKDLDFRAEFKLSVTRDDRCHAIIAWFDTDFTARGELRNPIRLSTSPLEPSTHWKQTVFYTPKDFDVIKGDMIVGSFACSPNSVNPRNLDFHLEWRVERNAITVDGTCGEYNYVMA